MQKQINQVLEFHKAFSQPISDDVNVAMPEARATLRNRLILEEVGELIVASEQNDITEVGDAIIDSMYILIGTAIEYGLHHKLEAMFDEVHSSNMSKLDSDGNPIRREDGKIVKGPNFREPNLHSIIFKNNS